MNATTPCCVHCTHAGPAPHVTSCRICFVLTPASFRMFDVLDLAVVAIREADTQHPAAAMAAWTDARAAAAAMTADPVSVIHALGLILNAAAPSRAGGPGRAQLLRTLDAASLACLLAADGDLDTAGDLLLDASGYAAGLPCQPAVKVIVTAIWDGSQTEAAAA